MRVAFVVNRFPELSETFILNQITGLLDSGHDVRIFAKPVPVEGKLHSVVEEYSLMKLVHHRAIVPSNKIICRLKALGMIAVAFVWSPTRTLKTLKLLISREEGFSYQLLFFILPILRKSFDIIHCHFGPNGNRGLYLKKIIPRIKLVTTFHGYDVTVHVKEQGINVYKELFEAGDIFTYNSEATKQKVLGLGGPPERMVKLAMGVDVEDIKFSKRTLGPGETVNILSVGRLVEMKGREYAIRAVAKVVQKISNVRYTIVGDGVLRQSLQELIDELDVGKWVLLTGWVEDKILQKMYKSSHIFLHPSVTAGDGNMEGQGVVLAEAQAYGLPVVATRHNAFVETVLDGKSGFLVPEKDVDALADRLEYLIKHPEVWPQMGRAGREFVEKNYDIRDLNQKLVQIYEQLLQQKD
jgi:colanic acid/amylovoran biosynthesis glycosyltransferase